MTLATEPLVLDGHLSPDWSNAALVTIDLQQDYARMGAQLCAPGAADILPRVTVLARAFRDAGLPIIHVVRLYKEEEDVDLVRRTLVSGQTPILRPGTDGADLVIEAKPSAGIRLDCDRLLDGAFQAIGPNEWVMYKPRWGAFYRTRLEHHLKDLGTNTIVFCGSSFPNGTRATVYQASERDFRIVLVSDGVGGLYEKGADELAQIGVTLLPADVCAQSIAAL